MNKRWFQAGGLAVVVLAGVLITAGSGRAQVFSTFVVNQPCGFTFYTFPAEYTPLVASGFPYSWPGAGMGRYASSAPRPIRSAPAVRQEEVQTASLQLQVPADATVWLEGQRTTQKGTERQFVSPPLAPDKAYGYQLRVVWRENGREIQETRRLLVRAGDRQKIMFLAGPNPETKLVAGR